MPVNIYELFQWYIAEAFYHGHIGTLRKTLGKDEYKTFRIDKRARAAAKQLVKYLYNDHTLLENHSRLMHVVNEIFNKTYKMYPERTCCDYLLKSITRQITLRLKIKYKYSHLLDSWKSTFLYHDIMGIGIALFAGFDLESVFHVYDEVALRLLYQYDKTPTILQDKELLAIEVKNVCDNYYVEDLPLDICNKIANEIVDNIGIPFNMADFEIRMSEVKEVKGTIIYME